MLITTKHIVSLAEGVGGGRKSQAMENNARFSSRRTQEELYCLELNLLRKHKHKTQAVKGDTGGGFLHHGLQASFKSCCGSNVAFSSDRKS
jgi:hypothetical protein